MFKNFFKIIYRDLVKDKIYTSISIFGLSAGISVAILIIAINMAYLSYDKFHSKGDRIYQAFHKSEFMEAGNETSEATPYLLGEALKSEYPEIADAATIISEDPIMFIPEGNSAGAGQQEGIYADASLFNIFSFPIITSTGGKGKNVFNDINSIAISKTVAEKYFGTAYNAVGKKIVLRRTFDKKEVYVTSVFENLPLNSTIRFEFVMPLQAAVKERKWLQSWPWGNYVATTYFELKPGVNVNELNKKISGYLAEKNNAVKAELFLYKYEDVFFNPPPGRGVDKTNPVMILFLIALIIIMIAAINFINLATSRAAKKSKEIGLRKVIGADRKSLMLRFMTETLMLSFISVFFGLLAAELLLPYINNSYNGILTVIIPYNNLYFIASLGTLWLLVGISSGIYPSWYLSSLQPGNIIKGIAGSGNGIGKGIILRKSLITLQFVFSALFIFITVVVYKQMNFITNKNLGVTINQVLELELTKDLTNHLSAFKNDLKSNPNILGVTTASSEPVAVRGSTSDPKWEGKPEGMNDMFPILGVGDNFFSTFDVKVIKGRAFLDNDSLDNNNVIINEKMQRIIGKSNPVGLSMSFWGKTGQIVGVVKDFNYSTLHENIGPIIIRKDAANSSFCFIRFHAGSPRDVLTFIENTYKKYEKEYPFSYKFLDEQYLKQHVDVKIFVGFFGLFAAIALIISCLGLFGLTAFSIQQKTKEVGIRKVLGASIGSIFMLLTKSMLKLILIAAIIALPAGYFISVWLLQMFVYKIDISIDIFFVTVLLVLVLSILTVISQVFRAATSNPVNSLKYE